MKTEAYGSLAVKMFQTFEEINVSESFTARLEHDYFAYKK